MEDFLKQMPAILLVMLLAAGCSGPASGDPSDYMESSGYMRNHSVGLNTLPEGTPTYKFLSDVWAAVNDSYGKTMLAASQNAYFTGHANSPFASFKPGTIAISFSIDAAGAITITKIERPESISKKQVNYVRDLILDSKKKFPPFPSALANQGTSEITDTIIFRFY